jgi:uncharacterized membrane protein YphA (DoxX/SURF4 family)
VLPNTATDARRRGLQRNFSTFPDGRAGVGLLLLRLALGAVLGAQGVIYLMSRHDLGGLGWTVGLLALGSGVFLLVGYGTPFASVLAAIIAAGSALSWFRAPSLDLFDSKLASSLVAAIAVAIACLGAGAFSIDARLFGPREIIIPSDPRSPKE